MYKHLNAILNMDTSLFNLNQKPINICKYVHCLANHPKSVINWEIKEVSIRSYNFYTNENLFPKFPSFL